MSGLRVPPLEPVDADRLGAYRAMADSVHLHVYTRPPARCTGELARLWKWIKSWFGIDPQHPVMA